MAVVVLFDYSGAFLEQKNVTAIALISHFIFHKNRGILFMR